MRVPTPYDERIQRALDRFPTDIPSEPPESLPLLDDFRERCKPVRRMLADADVLFVQHALGPFMCRLEAMFEDSLEPDRVWMVDIPYSTHEPIPSLIQQRFGVPRSHFAAPLRDPLLPYTTMQLRRVEETIYRMAGSLSSSRVLVVDDGAYFARALRNLEDLDPGFAKAFADRTCIVEQTTRGHRYLTDPEHGACQQLVTDVLRAPVVSIARSATKTQFEAPFIGAAAGRALTNAFQRESIDVTRLDQLALIGFGAVGEAVFRAIDRMGHKRRIHVVETDVQKHCSIRDLGGEPFRALPTRGSYDLIVGCTGYASFGLADWDALTEKAYLVSTSSAAVEFNRKQFIDLADLYPDDEIRILDREETRKRGIRATIHIRDDTRNREVSFINASFPVNFDGRMECLPAEIIQATHALLYAAGSQALQTARPGMQPLAVEVDEMLKVMAPEYLQV